MLTPGTTQPSVRRVRRLNTERSDWRAGDLRQRWVAVLRRLHAARTYPHRCEDPYRFTVVDVGEDGADLVVHAFFRAGERYCCYEPGCHFFVGRLDWARLRRAMAEECIDHLNPVRILQWRVTVEAGAEFHHGELKIAHPAIEKALSYALGPFVEPEEA